MITRTRLDQRTSAYPIKTANPSAPRDEPGDSTSCSHCASWRTAASLTTSWQSAAGQVAAIRMPAIKPPGIALPRNIGHDANSRLMKRLPATWPQNVLHQARFPGGTLDPNGTTLKSKAGASAMKKSKDEHRRLGSRVAETCDSAAAFLELGVMASFVLNESFRPSANFAKLFAMGLRLAAQRLRRPGRGS
jgi:hypothetical protein